MLTVGRCGIALCPTTDRPYASVDTSNPAIDRHFKTGHYGRRAETGFTCGGGRGAEVGWTLVRQLRGPHLRTWAWCSSRSSSAVTAAVSPSSLPQSSTGRFEVRSVERPFVAAHDELEQVLGGRVRQLAHAEVVDDEQRHGGQVGEDVLAGAVERGVGELLEQHVRLAVEHAMALLDGGAADGLGEVALAGAGRAEEERVLALLDEAAGGELVDRARDSSSC